MKRNVATFLALFLAFSCFSAGKNESSGDTPYKIGVLLRVTGELGNKLRQTVEKAFDDINATGGINGKRVELIVYDTQGDPSKATDAFNRLIFQDKVLLAIGPTTSSSAIGIISMAEKNKIPLITPQATATDITKKYGNPFFFRMSVADVYHAYTLADYILGDLQKKRVAIIYETEALGVGQSNDFIARMRDKYKMEPVIVEKFSLGDVDFKAQMLKIKAATPDVIVMTGHEVEMARAITQAYDVGLPRDILKAGFSSMSSSEYGRTAGNAATGSIFVTTFSSTDPRSDIQKFVTEYKAFSPDHNHAQAFDVVQIIKNALTGLNIENQPNTLEADRIKIRDALATKTNNIQGLSGVCTFGVGSGPEDRDGMKVSSVYSLNSDGTFSLIKAAK